MGICLDVSREGGVATVVIHHQGNNAISGKLATELKAAFSELGSDPSVRVVVLASAYERYFSVGADLRAVASIDRQAPDASQKIAALLNEFRTGFDVVAACPKPVIAAINGHALGAGCELALCCDYRIMAEDGRSRIGQSEVGLGLMPGAGGTQRLVRLIGRTHALPLLFEGLRLSADEAMKIGLVNQAVAPADFKPAVAELAERLAAAPTRALGLIKDAVNQGQELPLPEALELEIENFVQSILTQDAAVGIMSFLAKQPPEFTGA
ncbi:MAG: enoyl-CoA hydratase/isomerase family protein [Candidatus Dormibacteraceae bacterium]